MWPSWRRASQCRIRVPFQTTCSIQAHSRSRMRLWNGAVVPVIRRAKAWRHPAVSFAMRTTKRCCSERRRPFTGISEVARIAIQSTPDVSSAPSRWITPHCLDSVFDNWRISVKKSTRARFPLGTSTSAPVGRPQASHG